MFDYESLRFIWWLLIGVLLIGFAITDGFDLGVGSLLPFMGKTDTERRIMINTIAPHWEGNQVWLVTAGGALFAAWPQVYAVSFSGFYLAMLLVLCALFFRPVGFDYRSKLPDPKWRNAWDWGIFVGSCVPALVFGIAFGNLLQGVPFELDTFLRSNFQGSFWQLLNPFALLAGLVSVAMLVTQGAAWLQMKTTDVLLKRAELIAAVGALATSVLFLLAGCALYYYVDGYIITSSIDHNTASNPLLKNAIIESGAWLKNYTLYPLTWLAPIIGLLAPLGTLICSIKRVHGLSFLFSSLTIAAIILTAGISMFPFVMPSSTNPSHSLTAWDSTSSLLTLQIMLVVAIIFVPIILSYTVWSYLKMYGRLDMDYINNNNKSLY